MFLLDISALLPIFLTICFIALFAALGLWFKQRRDTRKKADAEQMARSLGLAFSEKDFFGLAPQLKAFEMFRHSRRRWGRNAQVTNVLRGKVGDTEVFQFDYSYVISTGKSARRISQTIFFANDKQWSLPDFHLRPEQWWHKVLAKLGIDHDINFPENPDFSQRFHLTSPLEELARTKFSPELQKFLLGGPRIHVEGSNYYLIAYHPRKVFRGEEARAFFERCCQLTESLKGENKQDLLDLVELKDIEKETPIMLPEAEKREL